MGMDYQYTVAVSYNQIPNCTECKVAESREKYEKI